MQPDQRVISDSDLLHAAARGDEDALAAIYDRYNLILFSLILRILGSREEAEDVLQEAFLQIWQRASDYDEGRGRVFTWLVTIARSRALDRARSRVFRERAETSEAATLKEHDDTAAVIFATGQGEMLRAALTELPDEQRLALYLAYFEGLTQTEIAKRLSQPLGTVKTRMRSGIIKLRQILREQVDRSI